MQHSGWSAILAVLAVFGASPCWAWGDEGHMIVAAVAERLLEPGVRDQVNALLSADDDTLTAGDFASRATWADKYRDSDGTPRSSVMRPPSSGTSLTSS